MLDETIRMREAIVSLSKKLDLGHKVLPYVLSGYESPNASLMALFDMGLIQIFPKADRVENPIVAEWRHLGKAYGLFYFKGAPAMIEL